MKLLKTAAAGFTPDDLRRADQTGGAAPHTGETSSPNSSLLRLAETMGRLDGRRPISPIVIAGLARLGEFLALWIAGFVAHQQFGSVDQSYAAVYLAGIPTVSALGVAAMNGWQLHTIAAYRNLRYAGSRVALVWCAAMLATFAVLAVTRPEHALSQRWIGLWFVLGLGALLLCRMIMFGVIRALTRQGRLERRTVIVGGGKAAEELLGALSERPDSDLRIFGVFDDRRDARSPDVVAGYPKLGTVSDLVSFARKTRIDLVIFTLPITAEERLLHMLRKLWVLPIDIRLAAHRNKLRFRPRSYSYIGDVPVLDVFDKPIADWDIVLKAVFDRVVGALALIALSPVLLATAVAVKLDSKGPVLFRQKRHGFNNELVEVYKFRSMYVDQLDHLAAKQVTKNDPRVTRVGRFIRKTSLDELPQLFNVVFKGDLSLVGPRPHAVHAHLANRAYDEVVDGYFARHRVKPGITGWAQVNGWRGETDTPEKIQKRVEHDLAYIENWSIFFDLYILLITPFALTRTENAY